MILPVICILELVNTTVLVVPPTDTATLPPDDTIATLLVPLVNDAPALGAAHCIPDPVDCKVYPLEPSDPEAYKAPLIAIFPPILTLPMAFTKVAVSVLTFKLA